MHWRWLIFAAIILLGCFYLTSEHQSIVNIRKHKTTNKITHILAHVFVFAVLPVLSLMFMEAYPCGALFFIMVLCMVLDAIVAKVSGRRYWCQTRRDYGKWFKEEKETTANPFVPLDEVRLRSSVPITTSGEVQLSMTSVQFCGNSLTDAIKCGCQT